MEKKAKAEAKRARREQQKLDVAAGITAETADAETDLEAGDDSSPDESENRTVSPGD
jgi:hypothetical protein